MPSLTTDTTPEKAEVLSSLAQLHINLSAGMNTPLVYLLSCQGHCRLATCGSGLIEAGVGCVTLSIGGWDTHGQNFQTLKKQLPQVDKGIAG